MAGAATYACPATGVAFEIEYPYGPSGSQPATITPTQPDRWCESDIDCGAPERCFLVTPERGICTATTGVGCDEYQPFAMEPQIGGGSGGAGGGGGANACESEQQCHYQHCSGLQSPNDWFFGKCDERACLSNGCETDADCGSNETCVPGWVGPTTANQCMPAECKSDADCADSPCQMCVFLKRLSWPFHSNPSITYDGATCI